MKKTSNPPSNLERDHWFVFGMTASVSFFAYLYTISPSIAGGDSGELVAEGCQLGTSHPPGYPLYTIIVYLATNVGKLIAPWKAPAYFVNLTSAVFGSTASGLLASSIVFLVQISDLRQEKNRIPDKGKMKQRRVSKSKSTQTSKDRASSAPLAESESDNLPKCISIFMGLMHSFSPLVWQYSVTAEVFALHNFFVAIIVHTTVRFAVRGDEALLLLGAFLCGLALTNQHTSILLSIPLILWVLSVTKIHLPSRWRYEADESFPTTKAMVPLLLKAAVAFLSGFVMIYGTMPLFARLFHHPGSWGYVTSFKGFLHHFLRSDYGSLRLYSGNDDFSESLWQRLLLWSKDFLWSQSLPFVGVATLIASKDLLMLEFEKLRRKSEGKRFVGSRKGAIIVSDCASMSIDTAILCSLLFYLVVFHSLSNLPLENPLFFGIHQRFWMHPNILCFILAGLGLTKLCRKFIPKSTMRTTFCSCILLAIVIYAYLRGFELSSQSHNVYFRNYASSILKTLPKDSVLFINYDQQWTSVRYMQECEGLRPDVTSINLSMMSFNWWSTKHALYPNIRFPGNRYTFHKGGFTFKDLLDANDGFKERAFIGGAKLFNEEPYLRQYEEIPHGIVRRIVTKAKSITNNAAESYRRESQRIWQVIAKEHSEGLPKLSQYGNDTWEWTIRREFYEHFTSRASYLLDLAVSKDTSKSSKLQSIVEACAWLEVARTNDEIANNSPGLWKNLGLGYMKIVQNSEKVDSFPNVKDVFVQTKNSHLFQSIESVWWNDDKQLDWKGWSSMRWEETWGHFLHMEEAQADPSYLQVKSMYDTVIKRVRG